MLRRGIYGRLVRVALTLIFCACEVGAQTATPAPGVPLDLARQRAAIVSDLRYDLSLTIPAQLSQPITGVTSVRFRLSDVAAPLVLDFDAGAQSVVSFAANGRSAQVPHVNGHLVIPASLLRRGENTLRIRFRAGDAPLNRSADFLYTLFVPARARQAVPCFDQPDLKGRWTLTLEHPAQWQSAANGAQVERSTTGERTRVRFAPTPPLPTYLVAFIAGDFKVETAQRGPWTLRMFHRENDAQRLTRNRDAIFDLHARALEDLQQYTAIPYPFSKFDFVLIPSFQFQGMEHAAKILYDAESLVLDETATQDDHLFRASVIAHETAHMWFGDLVTMRWFDDVWTKEVFAEFMAAKLVNPTFPAVNHDLRFFLAHHRGAYAVDRSAGANAIRQPLGNLDEAAQLYGPIIYQKAPVVMRQLEALLGEAAFRDGVREYLRTHAFGNATWDDLIAVLDARTPLDLKAWSRVWIDEPGRPTISTELVVQDGRMQRLALRQSDPQRLGRIWPQQLRVAIGCESGRKVIAVDMTAEVIELTEHAGPCALQYVLPSGDGWGYADFELDRASLDHLSAALHEIDDALTRGSAWVTLWDAMLAGRLTPERLFDTVAQALPREADEQIASRMLTDLSTIWWRFLTAQTRQARGAWLELLLRQHMERAESASLKSAWFRALRGIASTRETVSWLHSLWSQKESITGLPLAESDYTTLALELAVREVDGWSAMLDAQLARIENPDRRSRLQFIRPAVSSDASERARWFLALRDAELRRHEAWVLEGLRYLHHPLRTDASAAFVRPSLELLVDIQRTGDIGFADGWLDGTLSGHSSPQVATTVQSFLNELPAGYPARLRDLILQSADMLFRAVGSRPR